MYSGWVAVVRRITHCCCCSVFRPMQCKKSVSSHVVSQWFTLTHSSSSPRRTHTVKLDLLPVPVSSPAARCRCSAASFSARCTLVVVVVVAVVFVSRTYLNGPVSHTGRAAPHSPCSQLRYGDYHLPSGGTYRHFFYTVTNVKMLDVVTIIVSKMTSDCAGIVQMREESESGIRRRRRRRYLFGSNNDSDNATLEQ